MKNYRKRVIRRWWCWAVGTVIVLAILLSIGYAFLSLVDDVVRQIDYLLLVGGTFIVISFVLGQAMQGILVRSWDSWVGDLGPTQIDVLVQEMQLEAMKMRGEPNGKKKGSTG